MRHYNIDILVITETRIQAHSDPSLLSQEEKLWKSYFGRRHKSILFNSSIKGNDGIMIIYPRSKKIAIDKNYSYKGTSGRFLGLRMTFDDTYSLKLGAYYQYSNEQDKLLAKKLWTEIEDWLLHYNIQGETLIITGDSNAVLDPTHDRLSKNSYSKDTVMINWVNSNNLFPSYNFWSKGLKYTWKKPDENQSSVIDHCLTNIQGYERIERYEVLEEPVLDTDHRLVLTDLLIRKHRRSKDRSQKLPYRISKENEKWKQVHKKILEKIPLSSKLLHEDYQVAMQEVEDIINLSMEQVFQPFPHPDPLNLTVQAERKHTKLLSKLSFQIKTQLMEGHLTINPTSKIIKLIENSQQHHLWTSTNTPIQTQLKLITSARNQASKRTAILRAQISRNILKKNLSKINHLKSDCAKFSYMKTSSYSLIEKVKKDDIILLGKEMMQEVKLRFESKLSATNDPFKNNIITNNTFDQIMDLKTNHPSIGKPDTWIEFLQAMTQLKPNSAGGINTIRPRAFQQLAKQVLIPECNSSNLSSFLTTEHQNSINFLKAIFNANNIINEKLRWNTPIDDWDQWHYFTCILNPIFKNKNSPLDMANWRPVGLLNCQYKLLEYGPSKRLNWEMTQPSKSGTPYQNKWQKGFTQGVSITHILLPFILALDRARIDNSTIISESSDILGAFDAMNWNVLEEVLIKRGFDQDTINFFINLNKHIFVHVKTGHGLTQGFFPKGGGTQGAIGSPTKWKEMYNPIFFISPKNSKPINLGTIIDPISINMLGFADDLHRIQTGNLATEVQLASQTLIKEAEDMLLRQGLQLQIKKSKILALKGSLKGHSNLKTSLKSYNTTIHSLSKQDTYSIMGLDINGCGTYNPTRKEKGKLIRRRISLLRLPGHSFHLWGSSIQSYICSLTTSINLTPWFNDKWLHEIEGSISFPLRKALKVHNDCSRAPLYLPQNIGGLGLPQYSSITEIQFIQNFFQNYNSDNEDIKRMTRTQMQKEWDIAPRSFPINRILGHDDHINTITSKLIYLLEKRGLSLYQNNCYWEERLTGTIAQYDRSNNLGNLRSNLFQINIFKISQLIRNVNSRTSSWSFYSASELKKKAKDQNKKLQFNQGDLTKLLKKVKKKNSWQPYAIMEIEQDSSLDLHNLRLAEPNMHSPLFLVANAERTTNPKKIKEILTSTGSNLLLESLKSKSDCKYWFLNLDLPWTHAFIKKWNFPSELSHFMWAARTDQIKLYDSPIDLPNSHINNDAQITHSIRIKKNCSLCLEPNSNHINHILNSCPSSLLDRTNRNSTLTVLIRTLTGTHNTFIEILPDEQLENHISFKPNESPSLANTVAIGSLGGISIAAKSTLMSQGLKEDGWLQIQQALIQLSKGILHKWKFKRYQHEFGHLDNRHNPYRSTRWLDKI
jgi:hypothetical protein